jgi:hypothetical protein
VNEQRRTEMRYLTQKLIEDEIVKLKREAGRQDNALLKAAA